MRKTKLVIFVLIFTMIITSSFAQAKSVVSKWDGKTYITSSQFDDYVTVHGLDIYAGQNDCNFEKMKADGVDFVIIRIGYRGYGTEGKMHEDEKFYEYYQGAKAAGMLIGTYFFSQAHSQTEAREEVMLVNEIMKKYGLSQADFELPLFMDYEYSPSSGGRLVSGKYSKSTLTKTANSWMETAKALGYVPGIYASLNFFEKAIDVNSFANTYPLWVAQYNSNCGATYPYCFWQYGSSGACDGVGSKRCDTNIWFLSQDSAPGALTGVAASADFGIVDANATGVVAGEGADVATGTVPVAQNVPEGPSLWHTLADAEVYFSGLGTYTYNLGESFKPVVTVSYGGQILLEGVDYKVKYIGNTQAGTAYAMVIGMGVYTDYKLVPFTINPSYDVGGIAVSAIADKEYSGTAYEPTITITDEKGRTLRKGKDYNYSFSGDRTNVGTATVNIEFVGNRIGSKNVTYNIVKSKQQIKSYDARTTIDTTEPPYSLNPVLKYTDGKVSYESSDTEILTVSSDGLVTPIKKGTATITITAKSTENYSSAKVEIPITVTTPKLVQTVTTAYTKYTRDFDGKSFNVKAKTDGDGVITYASSNENIAKIDDTGKVTLSGIESGVVEFYVTASETEDYKQGMKVVYLTVYPREEEPGAGSGTDSDVASGSGADSGESGEASESKNQSIIDGVKSTSIKLKSSITSKGIKLNWEKSPGYKVDYYQVYRSTKQFSGFGTTPIYTTSTGTKTYYVNTKSLKKGTRYYYKVRGVRVIDGKKYYTEYSTKAIRTWK